MPHLSACRADRRGPMGNRSTIRLGKPRLVQDHRGQRSLLRGRRQNLFKPGEGTELGLRQVRSSDRGRPVLGLDPGKACARNGCPTITGPSGIPGSGSVLSLRVRVSPNGQIAEVLGLISQCCSAQPSCNLTPDNALTSQIPSRRPRCGTAPCREVHQS